MDDGDDDDDDDDMMIMIMTMTIVINVMGDDCDNSRRTSVDYGGGALGVETIPLLSPHGLYLSRFSQLR